MSMSDREIAKRLCNGAGVYRVHTVCTYPDGHPRLRGLAGEHNVTRWDIVVAPGCEEALKSVRLHYEVDGAVVKRIYSCNHIGDVTVGGGV